MNAPDAGGGDSRGSGWKRWLLPAAALPFLALLAFGLTRDARELPTALEGKAAPEFRLATLDAPPDSLGLDALRGKVVILNFWASWCGPCRVEHPVLIRADRAWPEEEVALVGVLYQDTPENARMYMARLGGDWPTLLDPQIRTAIDYGVYGVPETFIIGPDGRIAYKHAGALTWDALAGRVDSLVEAARAGETASR